MKSQKAVLAIGALVSVSALVRPAWAQQQVTPPPPILVTSPIVTINNAAGNQTLPHVDGDLAAYTDEADGAIHYYRFSSLVDTTIPVTGAQGPDTLSDVGGNHICFSRQTEVSFETVVFDTTTSTLTEIDPHYGNLRLGCAVGGNTLALVDFTTVDGQGDIFVYDSAANPPVPPQALSLSPNQEGNPNVSPDGNTVVWENCPTPSNCDVWKAVRSAGTWMTSVVANTAFNEADADTDGIWVAYDTNRGAATGQDIDFQPAAGGQETELAIPGLQVNPSVSKGFIGFESTLPSDSAPHIFVYDIANNELYQVTATPGVFEALNDISVLDNGDVRVVWTADDGFAHELNIYGTTFTPRHHQVSYQMCPLYDAHVAKKKGSAYPIKIQLCDGAGNNLSSPSIVVHAVSVTQTSATTPLVVDDTGNANPDADFRFDATLNGYVFNLSTKNYATGTYNLNFIAGADPNTHSAAFAVK